MEKKHGYKTHRRRCGVRALQRQRRGGLCHSIDQGASGDAHLSKRIDQALAAANSAGVKLMIGLNRRFDPNFAQVREVVEAGEIGEPHENGVLGSIDNSRQAVYGYDQRVEVFGSKGTVSADWYGWMRSVRKAYGVDGGMLPSMRFAVCADVASMRSRAR